VGAIQLSWAVALYVFVNLGKLCELRNPAVGAESPAMGLVTEIRERDSEMMMIERVIVNGCQLFLELFGCSDSHAVSAAVISSESSFAYGG
jgi:hypothetical protein